ncbi:hypothetical protein Plhal304r1_c073g0161051 [Plasmopara halstedii]
MGRLGTKLNVTSIVSQGLEQVRNLRDDVEKSFDQVVTGVPGVRGHCRSRFLDTQFGIRLQARPMK